MTETAAKPAARSLDLAALRSYLEQEAATHQRVGDDYSDKGDEFAWHQAYKNWGKSEAFRAVLAYIEKEA